MKRLMMTSLVAGQLMASTQPAMAAELADGQTQQIGGFGGVRVRIPLDGAQRQVRAGLTIAPAMQTRDLSGESRTRIGEGLELGLTGDEPLRLSVAGTPVSQLARGPVGPDGQRVGVSDLGWIAIGAGVVIAGVGLAALFLAAQ